MMNKKLLMAVSVSALLLGGCFNTETGAAQRAANGETETHAPAKHEAKHEAKAPVEKAAHAEEAKAEAPAAVETAAPAEEAKAEAPAAEETAAPAEEAKAEAPAAAAPNLSACKGCHGANFEKAAMGKSKVVSEMAKADVATALKGYKDGSYGGAMKGLMKGQVATLDDAAIEAIASAIGK